MSKNLITRNGRVIHAPAQDGIGSWERVVLCSNMRRDHATTCDIRPSDLLELQGETPVTCAHCCRILKIEAPKTLPSAAEIKAMKAYKPAPTQAETEAAIEAQRAAELDYTAARLAVDAGVQTWHGESYAAWLTVGTVEYAELMSTFQIEAAREYAWSLKLAAKMTRRTAALARKKA